MMHDFFPESRDSVVPAFRRGTVVEVDDAASLQFLRRMRGSAGELPERVPRFQDHGITSNPPAGSEGLLGSLGGRSGRLFALGFQHKDLRPRELPPGGVALYDADGKVLKIVKDEIDLDAGGKPVTIRNASRVKIQATDKVSIGLGDVWINIADGKVHLGVDGPDETATSRVLTEDGPAAKTFAKV